MTTTQTPDWEIFSCQKPNEIAFVLKYVLFEAAWKPPPRIHPYMVANIISTMPLRKVYKEHKKWKIRVGGKI